MWNGCEFKSRALRNGCRRQTGNIHGDYLPGATSAWPIWQINERLKLQTDIPGMQAHRGCVGLCLNFPLHYFVSQSSFIAVTWSFGEFPDGEPSSVLKTSTWNSAPLAGRVQKRAHTQQQQGSTCMNIHIRTWSPFHLSGNAFHFHPMQLILVTNAQPSLWNAYFPPQISILYSWNTFSGMFNAEM